MDEQHLLVHRDELLFTYLVLQRHSKILDPLTHAHPERQGLPGVAVARPWGGGISDRFRSILVTLDCDCVCCRRGGNVVSMRRRAAPCQWHWRRFFPLRDVSLPPPASLGSRMARTHSANCVSTLEFVACLRSLPVTR